MFQILPKCLFFPSLILFTEILFFSTGSRMENQQAVVNGREPRSQQLSRKLSRIPGGADVPWGESVTSCFAAPHSSWDGARCHILLNWMEDGQLSGQEKGTERSERDQATSEHLILGRYWKKGGPEPLESSDLKAVKKIYSRLSLSSKINSWRRRTPELMKTSILGPSLRKWKQLAYVHGRHRCSETPEGGYGVREDGAWSG